MLLKAITAFNFCMHFLRTALVHTDPLWTPCAPQTLAENKLKFHHCSSLYFPFKKSLSYSPAKDYRAGETWTFSMTMTACYYYSLSVTHLPELQQLALRQRLEQQLEHPLAGRWVAGGNTRKHQYQCCKWYISFLLRTNAAVHQLLWVGPRKGIRG